MNQQHKRKSLPPTPPRGANGKQSSVTPSCGNHTKKKGKTIDDAAPSSSAAKSTPNPADESEFPPLYVSLYTEKYRSKSGISYSSINSKKPTAAAKVAETMADDGEQIKSARKYPNRSKEGTRENNPILTTLGTNFYHNYSKSYHK
jgi:hypothetical protein